MSVEHKNFWDPKPRASTDLIEQAIEKKEILHLEYQGNTRYVIPLVWGTLKNGKKALLCYKILNYGQPKMELAIRLFHKGKIRNVMKVGKNHDLQTKIDYYLTKHYAIIDKKL